MDCHCGSAQGSERGHRDGSEEKTIPHGARSLKPFYKRSSNLRHTVGDKLARLAWGADLGLKGGSDAAAPMYTLIEERGECIRDSPLGVSGKVRRWRLLGLGHAGRIARRQFVTLHLDTFYALWILHPPNADQPQKTARPQKRALLSWREALTSFRVETMTTRSHAVGDRRVDRVEHVYNFCSPYWRVRFPNNYWDELTASEMGRCVKKRVKPTS